MTAYERWRMNVANTAWATMNQQIAAANTATEQDRNQAMGAVSAFQGMDFGLPQSTITGDRNTLLAGATQFQNYRPDFSGTSAMIGEDRTAGLQDAARLSRGGTAMEDRATMLLEADRLRQAAMDAGDRTGIERDRARMMAELAEFKSQSAGLGEENILKTLNEQWAREQASMAQGLQMAMQVEAARGVQMDPWKLSQIGARMNASAQERMAAQETSLRMQDLQMRQAARQFALEQMGQTLSETRSQELQAAGMGLAGQEAAAGLRQSSLDTTRQDQFARESAGAQLAASTRESTRNSQAMLDQVREQLRLSRDTAGMELLDRALSVGREETRANLNTSLAQQQSAVSLLVQILQGTDRNVLDPSTVAQLISGLAG